jgi:hypothetical protein
MHWDEDTINELLTAPLHSRGWPSYFKQCYTLHGEYTEYWDWPGLAVNVAVCLLLLALAAVAIEWATRRMKRGAP